MATNPPRASELLIKAREKIGDLTGNLQHVVDPANISVTAKVPYKLLCFREALLWRTEELARTALSCLERKDLAAAGLLTRSVTESAAAAWYIKDLVERHTQNLNAADLDEKAMALLLGHKLKEAVDVGTPTAINILSMIDKVDKDIPGFRKSYDALSEAAHPNWRGTAGLFSTLDRSQILTRFGRNVRNVEYFEVQAAGLLVASLQAFTVPMIV